ncbi:hypothetical protein [Streptomyces sp. NPDC102490]|jgi:hypothetical protein|uniref:hypothetical protein n=1 Tax=Streptomyces sp. NPDC102490 TaxID=3366183 RepID=UPI00380F1D44
MRRRTGAAGIAVAIAAIVPLASPAPAQDLNANLEPDCRSFTYQEAVPIGLDGDPGAPDPSCPEAGYEDPSDEAPLEEGGLDEGRLDGDGVDDGRLDGGLPDGSGAGQARPDENGLGGDGLGRDRPDEGRIGQDRPGQSHTAGQGPFDPGGIREVREDDGAGGAARADRDQLPTISATSVPRPATTAPAPVTTPAPVTSPAVTPTLGTQGGLGGASGAGPSDWDIGIGLSFVTGAALAAGYVIRRRRRA